MNISEVTIKLISSIPYRTDEFTNFLSATISGNELVGAGRTIEIETSTAHGLITGGKVLTDCGDIKNTIKEIVIDDDEAVIEFDYVHDYVYESTQTVNIVFAGNDVPAWDGTFELLDVPSKTKITIAKQSDAVPTVYGYIWEDRSKAGSGYVEITSISATKFSFDLDSDTPSLPLTEFNSLKIITGCRISGVADPERAIQVYTQKSDGKASFLFVMLGDEIVSKNLKTQSDATATFGSSDDSKLKTISTIDIISILPTTSTGAYLEVEKSMGEIRQALLDCLQGYVFENDDAEHVYKAIYTGSKPHIYDTATYVRSYSFQVVEDITSRQEVASKAPTVALRDTMISLSIGSGEAMTVTLEHGEENA